ncbi:MAG: hypothetical protein AAGC60_29005, partial [Acidobacteriota bacterium]
MNISRSLYGMVIGTLLVACAPAAWANYQLPHLERGFSQVTGYDFGALDHVNLFNGNLVVTLPIGQAFEGDGALAYRLALVYNAMGLGGRRCLLPRRRRAAQGAGGRRGARLQRRDGLAPVARRAPCTEHAPQPCLVPLALPRARRLGAPALPLAARGRA